MSDLDAALRELGLKMLAAISSLRGVLLDRFPNSFGGLYYSGDGLNFVVLAVGDDHDLRQFVAAYLRETNDDAAIAAQLPTVMLRPALHTLRQLLDLTDRISAERDELRAQGIVVYSAGVRDNLNDVAVLAAPLSDHQRDEFHRRFGAEIQILTVKPPPRRAERRSGDGGPHF